MESSPVLSSYEFTTPDNETYNVDVLLDHTHAKIWTIKNFLKPQECADLMEYGRPRLTRATVAAEDGSSIISEHRKANQAGYDFVPSEKHPTDPLE